MAINETRQPVGRGEGIAELTIADDEEEKEVVVPALITGLTHPTSATNGPGSKTKPSFVSITHATNATNVPSTPTKLRPSSSQHSQHGSFSQSSRSPGSRQPDDHPSKRRKLQNGAEYKTASPTANAKALTRCLRNQVFPYLEQATRKLDRNVYDTEGLGRTIIGKIADQDFERHFHNGNGYLSPDTQAAVIVRIHGLVKELMESYRHPAHQEAPQLAPKPVAPSTPSVLPSIETPLNEPAPVIDEDYGEAEEYLNDVTDSEVSPRQPQTPTRVRPKKKAEITPQQQRTRLKATQWQSGRSYEFKKKGSPPEVKSQWFRLSSRPYIGAEERRQIAAGVRKGRPFHLRPDELHGPVAYHVDFSNEEVRYLRDLARYFYGKSSAKTGRSHWRDLRRVLRKSSDVGARILDAHRQGNYHIQGLPVSLLKRSEDDISRFLDDLRNNQANLRGKSLYIERDDSGARSDVSRANIVPSLLLSREIAGNSLGATRRYQNFVETVKSNWEDYMEPKVEWTNCAGDIMTISWLSDATRFVCGTTTHSDSHNQQYNKPGNLLFGDAKSNTLKAYPDHRIPRPLVTHGDNALDSMRESQDPWLYTSVVSSDYDPAFDLVFTSSFDNTVKVWYSRDGTMTLRETWYHEGRVNFVVTDKNNSVGKVATAADVPTRAVRVYYPNPNNFGGPPGYSYDEFSCKRVHGEDYVPSDKWAYFPSAIRWGVAPSVNHLLLIGYSPRSLNGDDNEIPEDQRDTGELCLWDTSTNTEVKVNSAATANVFEVAWHPYRASFIAATSASQTSEKIEEHIRTQIRIFELNESTGQYGVIKTLDCPAIDINELAIRPNCTLYSYVAAGCTDGKVYVWDSAFSEDTPMCILEHGEPVEEIIGDRETEDVGVKFLAWATTADRLYTGSSDGVVKVWNIRHRRGVLVRDLISVPAPITAGAFSPDFKKLLIGDGSGRVYLLDMEDEEEKEGQNNSAAVSSGFLNVQLDGKQRAIRRPRPFIPHDEVPPPNQDGGNEPSNQSEYQLGQQRAMEYLDTAQLILHPDPTIGAVQGPAYPETGLYRAEAHLDGNVEAPLLGGFEAHQRDNQSFVRTTRFPVQRSISTFSQDAWQQHAQNLRLDLDVERLDPATRLGLLAERAELECSPLDLDYDSSSSDED
ncbi:WD40 repeat-like protein [Hypomontagnella monticulosa]|nr:WD40 repeat-like protein [Hypomontagnella monticulosa]